MRLLRRLFYNGLPAMTTRRGESGAVAVIVVLCLTVFIGFTALVVDMGYLYNVRRQLQAAADAAALAGCQELINGKIEAEVLAEAEKYAEGDGTNPYNNVPPADGLQMIPPGENNPGTGAPYTEVTDTYVKVTVKKDTDLFFGRFFGLFNKTVMAQSKAKIAYLTGLANIVPWGIPIIRANQVTVKLGDGVEMPLTYNSGTKKWERQLPVDVSASTSGYGVTVIAYNSQTQYPDGTSEYPNGVPEPLELAASVVVQQAGARIQRVYLDQNFVTAGQVSTVNLFVEATETPSARLNNKNYDLTPEGSPNLYKTSLPVPIVSVLKESFPIDVWVGSGTDKYEILSAVVLVVRRSTYPIKEVSLSPTFFTEGLGNQTSVSVELNDYEYDVTGNKVYELKVMGGAGEIGNFCALDLATIKHPPNWRNPQDPSEYDITTDPNYAPPAYYNYLEMYFPFLVHLGDTIWTNTGVLSTPQTIDALDTRFDEDNLTFLEWLAAGKPRSRRVVFVPVVEKMQITIGQTPMSVVSFAAFYVDDITKQGNDSVIKGHFLEYVAPSVAMSDTPPDSKYYLETPRLVSDGLDF